MEEKIRNTIVNQGEIWLAKLISNNGKEHIISGIRPVLIMSNKRHCNKSPVLTVVPISTKFKNIPTHVFIQSSKLNKLSSDSYAQCEQAQPLNKYNLVNKLGVLSKKDLYNVKKLMAYQIDFNLKIDYTTIIKINCLIERVKELDEYLDNHKNDKDTFKERTNTYAKLMDTCYENGFYINGLFRLELEEEDEDAERI